MAVLENPKMQVKLKLENGGRDTYWKIQALENGGKIRDKNAGTWRHIHILEFASIGKWRQNHLRGNGEKIKGCLMGNDQPGSGNVVGLSKGNTSDSI